MDLADFVLHLTERRAGDPESLRTDRPASDTDLVAVEASFDARLPEVYRGYLATVGGGRLGGLHVFSVVPDGGSTAIREGNYRMRLVREDVLGFAGNDEGDVYGFPIVDHVAGPDVVFWDHEENQLLPGRETCVPRLRGAHGIRGRRAGRGLIAHRRTAAAGARHPVLVR